MAFEDFTTYTEKDVVANKITVTTNKIEYTAIAGDEEVYVAKDFGENYFSDFKIQVKVYLSEATKDESGAAGGLITWGMSNIYHTWYPMGVNADGLTLRFSRTGDNYLYALQDMGTGATDAYIVGDAVPIEQWLEIERLGTTLTCKVYSDAYSTLVDTMSVICEETGFSNLIAIGGNETGDEDTATGYVENLEIISRSGGGSKEKNFLMVTNHINTMYTKPALGMGITV